LFRPRDSNATGDTGWSPPVLIGSRMYLPRHGVSSVTVFDFADVTPGQWEPKVVEKVQLPETISRGPDGRWLDRWTAGSPLIWDGIVYECDIYQTLYAAELKSGKMLYRREMELAGFMHYNSVPVAASPTLVGRHIVLLDNQGTALLVEPGPQPRVVA